MNIQEHIEREIIELHEFFQQWYRGELPKTDEAFGRFSRVMAPDFQIILPGGHVLDRDAILDHVRKGHGEDRKVAGGFTIEIRNVRHRFTAGKIIVATYEEWHGDGDESRGRVSSVVFSTDDTKPNGLYWRHLHETWLENAE
ncbi:MAG: DUF4440 domain-containing protein [Phycisphaerales bacterium]|nr:MAG: DUF4440 domain-containing protein [Phycisphaerales bacterium]